MQFIKKLGKLKPRKIKQLVYCLNKDQLRKDLLPKIDVDKTSFQFDGDFKQKLYFQERLIYSSTSRINVHLLKLIESKSLPVIGDCLTVTNMRGKSIYPYALQLTLEHLFKTYHKVYIFVSPENIPSIKGIEKAGFKSFCSISAIRIGLLYFNKKIIYFK